MLSGSRDNRSAVVRVSNPCVRHSATVEVFNPLPALRASPAGLGIQSDAKLGELTVVAGFVLDHADMDSVAGLRSWTRGQRRRASRTAKLTEELHAQDARSSSASIGVTHCS
jgi:hypothetical protein